MLLAPFSPNALTKEAGRDILSAHRDEVLRGHHLLVFLENLEGHVEGHLTQIRDLIGDPLQILVRKVAQDRSRRFVAEQRQQNRRLARAAERCSFLLSS
jgi:hypothetical protein